MPWAEPAVCKRLIQSQHWVRQKPQNMKLNNRKEKPRTRESLLLIFFHIFEDYMLTHNWKYLSFLHIFVREKIKAGEISHLFQPPTMRHLSEKLRINHLLYYIVPKWQGWLNTVGGRYIKYLNLLINSNIQSFISSLTLIFFKDLLWLALCIQLRTLNNTSPCGKSGTTFQV